MSHLLYVSCKYCFVKTGAGSTKNRDSVRTKQQLVCVVHIKVGWTWLLGVRVVVVLMCSYPKWNCLQESVHYCFTMFSYTFCKYCLSVWLNKWVIIDLQFYLYQNFIYTTKMWIKALTQIYLPLCRVPEELCNKIGPILIQIHNLY